MRTIILSNGQIVEELETQKKAVTFAKMNYVENKDYISDDCSIYIEYKNGSHYYLSANTGEIGRFRRTGIKSMIESNEASYTVYGIWIPIKTDDSDSDEDCIYNIEVP